MFSNLILHKTELVLQGRPPRAEGVWTIKHSLMRFNLVNNVTLAPNSVFVFRPHHWDGGSFLGEI